MKPPLFLSLFILLGCTTISKGEVFIFNKNAFSVQSTSNVYDPEPPAVTEETLEDSQEVPKETRRGVFRYNQENYSYEGYSVQVNTFVDRRGREYRCEIYRGKGIEEPEEPEETQPVYRKRQLVHVRNRNGGYMYSYWRLTR